MLLKHLMPNTPPLFQRRWPNHPVNRTPKSFAFGFPPLRSGAGYFHR